MTAAADVDIPTETANNHETAGNSPETAGNDQETRDKKRGATVEHVDELIERGDLHDLRKVPMDAVENSRLVTYLLAIGATTPIPEDKLMIQNLWLVFIHTSCVHAHTFTHLLCACAHL